MKLSTRDKIEKGMSIYFIAVALGTMANQLMHMLEAKGAEKAMWIKYNVAGEYGIEIAMIVIAFVFFVYLSLRNYGYFEKTHTITKKLK